MTLKRYLGFSTAILVSLCIIVWHDLFYVYTLLGAALLFCYFLPTYIAMKRRYEHRMAIAVFNIVCCPVAWVMVATGTTTSLRKS